LSEKITMQTKLKINGMTCEMCVRHVTTALQSVPNVKSAVVDLHAGEATVDHDNASVEAMKIAVEEEGYEAQDAQ
jgi:copper chaperone